MISAVTFKLLITLPVNDKLAAFTLPAITLPAVLKLVVANTLLAITLVSTDKLPITLPDRLKFTPLIALPVTLPDALTITVRTLPASTLPVTLRLVPVAAPMFGVVNGTLAGM